MLHSLSLFANSYLLFLVEKMNLAAESMAKAAIMKVKKAQKSVRPLPGDAGVAPQTGSRTSSTGLEVRALSSTCVFEVQMAIPRGNDLSNGKRGKGSVRSAFLLA